MKKISILLVFVAMFISTAIAADKAELNRVVLSAARDFDEVYVSGDATVEFCYNKRHSGLIVYNNTPNNKERIRCYSDNSKLFIHGEKKLHGIKSRIVVFYDEPLKRIVNNGAGTILAARIPDDSSFDVIINGSGSVKFGKKLSLDNIKLINNGGGAVHIPKISAKTLTIITNSSADIAISKVKVRNATFITNGRGTIKVSGKVLDATMTTNGSGSIDARDLRCRTIKATVTGSGDIDCNAKQVVTTQVYGTGTITCVSMPKDGVINGTKTNVKVK